MITVHHPLLEALRAFNAEAASRFPARFDKGLGQMGMLLCPNLEQNSYWCTPLNSMTFAETGGDGVHFSFMIENNCIDENSPVIVTVPANSGEPEDANVVVADSLRNFLRFGLYRGYFALEQLVYHRDFTLHVYGSPEWQPTEDWHYAVGYYLDENAQRVRDFLVEQFDLTPLKYTVAESEALQEKYMPSLEYPPQDEW